MNENNDRSNQGSRLRNRGVCGSISSTRQIPLARVILAVKRKPNQQESTLQVQTCDFNHHSLHNHQQHVSPRYIHRSPLRMIEETANECADSCTRASGIIIFNLALVYHLRSLSVDQSDREKQLRRAQCFYEQAYSLHLNEKGSVDGIRALASLNNLGHVNILLHNEYNANECWKMLLSLIVYLTESTGVSPTLQSDLRSFMGNVTHLILDVAVSAPAA